MKILPFPFALKIPVVFSIPLAALTVLDLAASDALSTKTGLSSPAREALLLEKDFFQLQVRLTEAGAEGDERRDAIHEWQLEHRTKLEQLEQLKEEHSSKRYDESILVNIPEPDSPEFIEAGLSYIRGQQEHMFSLIPDGLTADEIRLRVAAIADLPELKSLNQRITERIEMSRDLDDRSSWLRIEDRELAKRVTSEVEQSGKTGDEVRNLIHELTGQIVTEDSVNVDIASSRILAIEEILRSE